MRDVRLRRRPPTRAIGGPSHPSSWRSVAAGLAVFLSACSFYSQERGQRLEQRLDRIESDRSLTDLEKDRATSQQLAQPLEARIAELEKKAAAAGATERPRAGDDAAARQKLADELGRLRAALDAQARRLDAIEGRMAQLRSGSGGRVAESAPRPPRPEPRPQARAAPATEGAPAPTRATEVPSDRARYLAFAREREVRGDRSAARDLYEEYVAHYPDDPSAAEAHFRLGELAYGEKRYHDATLEFGKVAKEFPSSERAPEALLRTADSMMGMKLRDDAIAILSQVPKRYPGSPAATRATQRLTELQSGTGTSAGR